MQAKEVNRLSPAKGIYNFKTSPFFFFFFFFLKIGLESSERVYGYTSEIFV